MFYELDQLSELGFSDSAAVAVEAAIKGAQAALLERERYLVILELGSVEEKERVLEQFAWLKPEDSSLVTRADIIATAVFHNEYFIKRPRAYTLTEEMDYLGAWPHIQARCLSDNWHFLHQHPDNVVVDGIDGTKMFESGLAGCGVWVMGVGGWAVYVAIPAANDYRENRVPSPFVSVAQVGVGIAAKVPGMAWHKVDVRPFDGWSRKVGHGITIHEDLRFARVYEFLKKAGGSDWVFSIGHAIGEEMVRGRRGLYIHGQLAPHDFHPARVFLEAMQVEYFAFVVDPAGVFSLLPSGVQPAQFNPVVRLGICGGYDRKRVRMLREVVLNSPSNLNELVKRFSAHEAGPSRFFVAAGSHR